MKRVISHPQATAQCPRFLRERLPGAERGGGASTADAVLSVRDVREATWRSDRGSRPSCTAAEVLVADVEDHPDNVTRFVWLAPAARGRGAGGKTSLVFWGGGDQSPGWLVHALQELADRGVNLTRIESRPRRTSLGHYMFFVDLEGGAGEPAVSRRAGGAARSGGGVARSRVVSRVRAGCLAKLTASWR